MRLLCLLVLSFAASAQSGRGTITGAITNPDGGVVAAAPIQLRHVEAGKLYKTSSSANGGYSVSGLPAGTYELTIPTIGFTYAKYERKNIVLGASQTLRVDLRLEWDINLGTIGDDDSAILRSGRSRAPAGPAPRTPSGKPDFTGVWNGQNDANPEQATVLPWAEVIAKERAQSRGRDHPEASCLPGDVLLTSPNLFKIVQTPALVVILAEYNNGAFRQIFLDGRGHPKDLNPTWMGHSIGRWDRDTLVVDTIGFNDKSWLGLNPHTEMLHAVTRYRRPDLGAPRC